MLALAHHYNEPVASPVGTYRARVYGQQQEDGMWGGWIVFFPFGGGRVISTSRETTQSTLAQLGYWASGLTHLYLHGALERALALQPEAQLATELERLEHEDATAALRADTLEIAARVARAESDIVAAERDRTEDELLATVAETAKAEAAAHEQAADVARSTARAAGEALGRRRSTPARSSPKKK